MCILKSRLGWLASTLGPLGRVDNCQVLVTTHYVNSVYG